MSATRGKKRYKGLNEFVTFQKNLPFYLRTVTTTIAKEQGRQMYEATQSRVPVRTGRLKASGGWTVGNLFLSIFYNEYYARWVDEGTSRFSGRHYFKAVLDQHISKMKERLNTAIANEIKRRLRSS